MNDTRAFEMTLEIAVPADAVWQALTTAEELVRWFPTEANITPGQGGKWMISWNGNWPWKAEIEIWEPGRHLRLIDPNARPYDAEGKAVNESIPPLPISIDWHLEAKDGSTSLRLVHSGFGRGSDWDDEYQGVSLGWNLELNGLKHYLERHRGADRRVAWNRTVVPATAQVLWPRLAEGILRDRGVASADGSAPRPGARYATTLSTGDRLEGTVVAVHPNRGFQMTVDELNGALYRLWVDRVGADLAVNSWLSTYGIDERVVKDFDARMQLEIDRVASAVVA